MINIVMADPSVESLAGFYGWRRWPQHRAHVHHVENRSRSGKPIDLIIADLRPKLARHPRCDPLPPGRAGSPHRRPSGQTRFTSTRLQSDNFTDVATWGAENSSPS